MSRPPCQSLKLSRNELVRQRQIEMDEKRQTERRKQSILVAENRQVPSVRALLLMVSIPFLSVLEILSFLDNRSIIAYARINKPIRASVLKHPNLLTTAKRQYHEQCRQRLNGSKLICHVRRLESEILAYKECRSKMIRSGGNHGFLLQELARDIDASQRKLSVLIKRIDKTNDFSFASFQINERMLVEERTRTRNGLC